MPHFSISTDLQTLPGSRGKAKIRLVLGVPLLHRVHLPARPPPGFHPKERPQSDEGSKQRKRDLPRGLDRKGAWEIKFLRKSNQSNHGNFCGVEKAEINREKIRREKISGQKIEGFQSGE